MNPPLHEQIKQLIPVFAEVPLQDIAVKFTHTPQHDGSIKTCMFEFFSTMEAANGIICRLLAKADTAKEARESYLILRELIIAVASQIPRVGELVMAAKLAPLPGRDDQEEPSPPPRQ